MQPLGPLIYMYPWDGRFSACPTRRCGRKRAIFGDFSRAAGATGRSNQNGKGAVPEQGTTGPDFGADSGILGGLEGFRGERGHWGHPGIGARRA